MRWESHSLCSVRNNCPNSHCKEALTQRGWARRFAGFCAQYAKNHAALTHCAVLMLLRILRLDLYLFAPILSQKGSYLFRSEIHAQYMSI
jgi:hypothetical protein